MRTEASRSLISASDCSRAPASVALVLLGEVAGHLGGDLGAHPAPVLLDVGLGGGPDRVRGRPRPLGDLLGLDPGPGEDAVGALARLGVDLVGDGPALGDELGRELLRLLDHGVRGGGGVLTDPAGLGQQGLGLLARA